MPRQPRLIAPGLMYHIIARGIERREIFRDKSDYRFFQDRLGEILNDTGTKCHAFILMPNHFHLLLVSSNISISSVMRRLLTGYALYFNRRYKRAGHLFQNRYKSIICEEDPYLLELVRYIHLNPVRAEICKTLSELGNYPYSSHRVLLGKEKYNWFDAANVLALFGKTSKRAVKHYLEFIAEGLLMGRDSKFSGGGLKRSLNIDGKQHDEKQAFDERILGSSDYVLNLQTLTEKKTSENSDKKIDELLNNEAKSNGLSLMQLLGGGKSRAVTAAKAGVARRAVTELGLSFAEIARQLNIHRSSVTRLIEKSKDYEDANKVSKL